MRHLKVLATASIFIINANLANAGSPPTISPGQDLKSVPAATQWQKPETSPGAKVEREIDVGGKKFRLSSVSKRPGILLTLDGPSGSFSKLITAIDSAQINAFLDGAAALVLNDQQSRAFLMRGGSMAAGGSVDLSSMSQSEKVIDRNGAAPGTVKIVTMKSDQSQSLEVISNGILRRASTRINSNSR